MDNFNHYDQKTFETLLEALRQLGGQANRREVVEKTAGLLGLTEDDLSQTSKKGTKMFDHRLGWTKWVLSLAGSIEKSDPKSRGVWHLSDKGWSTTKVDVAEMLAIRDRYMANRATKKQTKETVPEAEVDDNEAWRSELLAVLGQISPYQFELMCGELLRKMGFCDIDITKKSQDKGIDGTATKKVDDIINFKFAIQCKRYGGLVGSPEVQKFRGSLPSQIDRALLITTGRFSPQAQQEADATHHAVRIDLIDGEQLTDKMYQFKLGVTEKIVVDQQFFTKYQH